MGGSTSSTMQPNGSNLSQLFGQQTGYQQTPLQPAITQPQYPAALNPTPEQAAAATVARMQARTPVMAAPVTAPKKQQWEPHGGSGNGPGGLGGRGM